MRSRLALLAVAALAGLALTGCQRDPSIAATVGSEKVTEAQVDAVLADAQHNRPQSPDGKPLPPLTINRADVVRYLVIDKMCATDQGRRHFARGEAGDISGVKQIAPDSQYAKLFASMTACLNGEVAGVKPATPTDAEVRELYDRAVAQGLDVPSFDKVKDQLTNNEAVQQRFGFKRALEGEAKAQNVSVNPRYRPLEVGLLPADQNAPVPFEGPQLLVATLGQTTDAVQSF